MNKKIVITGGAGFIGSNLANSYILHGHHDVVVIDNLSSSNLGLLDSRVSVLITDLDDPSQARATENILEDADVVYHFASTVGVALVDRDPKAAIKNILSVNQNMFPLFEKYNNRVIFASTSEVYGETQHARETDVLCIGNPDVLRWGYACGKLMSEFLLKAHSFPGTIARFFNVVGSGQTGAHGMVLPRFITQAKNGEDLIVYGDGTQTRALCDIRDAVSMLHILSDDQHVGETYNVGNSNNIISVNDLASLVIKHTSSRSHIKHVNFNDVMSDQSRDILTRTPCTEKMDKFYRSQYNVDDIITSLI